MARIPGFVGPPMPPDELGVEERACLLRASRKRLLELQDELHKFEGLPGVYGAGPISATMAEVACMARAVSWLWRQQTARAPP